jgi:hypothetical protein
MEATLILRFSEPARFGGNFLGFRYAVAKTFLVNRFDDDYLRHVVTKPGTRANV